MGVEKLLGKGHMLFKQGIDVQRLHGAYIDEDEIEEYVNQLEIPTYDIGLMVAIQDLWEPEKETDEEEPDKLLDEAGLVVSAHRIESAAFLMRKLEIGHKRAASLIQEMERNGVVGPAEGSKHMKVLISAAEEVNFSDRTAMIRNTPISNIVGRYISILKKGEYLQAACPFHAYTNQSLKVNDSKGMYKCFVCGAGGDAISFVMEFKKIEFSEAIKEIEGWEG
jgi:hypothetical protein